MEAIQKTIETFGEFLWILEYRNKVTGCSESEKRHLINAVTYNLDLKGSDQTAT